MPTDLDLTRRALAEIGTRTTISAMDDGSPEASYASLLYNPLRDFLLREGDYDWAMDTIPAVETFHQGGAWAHSYEYPSGVLRIRSAIPFDYLRLRPRPVEYNVWHAAGTLELVTNVPVGTWVCTFAPDENAWDSIFQESFVRLLGSALTFALQNRIEASKKALEESIQFARIADMRQR